MASGYTTVVGGKTVDLDDLLLPRATAARADTGIQVGGNDLAQRYEKYIPNRATGPVALTGIKSNGVDLNGLFVGKKEHIPYPITKEIPGLRSIFSARQIVNGGYPAVGYTPKVQNFTVPTPTSRACKYRVEFYNTPPATGTGSFVWKQDFKPGAEVGAPGLVNMNYWGYTTTGMSGTTVEGQTNVFLKVYYWDSRNATGLGNNNVPTDTKMRIVFDAP